MTSRCVIHGRLPLAILHSREISEDKSWVESLSLYSGRFANLLLQVPSVATDCQYHERTAGRGRRLIYMFQIIRKNQRTSNSAPIPGTL
ncbi:hypothetical protein AVEN_142962-1 [Araneus ventricosus]|uniref:Uncharacterized protein n=1 Tax=Araneus ventricosus TaxID=182803 RepID=A0A4Y2VR47_ARAVE|nr:hypothetical protein AVEN_142962-1 [Araneus ventricosus]